MPSSDQLLKHEGRGLISPTREGIGEVVHAYRRTGVVRLLPGGFKRGAREFSGSRPSPSVSSTARGGRG